jgi:N utilization substance protein B
MMISHFSSQARSRARQAVLQALYQWQMSGLPPAEIASQFLGDRPMQKVDIEYFQALLHHIPEQVQVLDRLLVPLLDRSIDQVGQVERALLRMGAFELMCRPDVPWRVVINEAVKLAKIFGADQSHRYINGILDKLARQVRPEALESAPVYREPQARPPAQGPDGGPLPRTDAGS